jgi:hypothetical protein
MQPFRQLRVIYPGSLCLDVSFRQNCRHKKMQANAFLQANTFICSQTFFLQATLFIKKIANDNNLSSYVSQGDGGLKKNNPYLIKLVRE